MRRLISSSPPLQLAHRSQHGVIGAILPTVAAPKKINFGRRRGCPDVLFSNTRATQRKLYHWQSTLCSSQAEPVVTASETERETTTTTGRQDNIEAYGLHIHQSSRILGPDNTTARESSSERSDELIEIALQRIHSLKSEFKYYMDTYDGAHTNDKEVWDLMEEYKNRIAVLYDNMSQLKTSLQKMYSFLKEEIEEKSNEAAHKKKPILTFHFEFRGLMLTCIHTVENLLKEVQSDSRDSLEKNNRVMHVLTTLSHMGLILTQERESVLNKCISEEDCCSCHRVVYYPFSDSLNINDYEQLIRMNVNDYFEHLGDQYAPMLRLFYSLMVSVTASHNASLAYDSQFRTGIFFASNLYYILNTKKAAEEASTFFSQNISAEAGKGLWTMPDTNPLVKTFSFLALPHIETSIKFHIPLLVNHEDKSKDEVAESVKKKEDKQAAKTEKAQEDLEGLKLQEIIGHSSMKEFEFYCKQVPKVLAATENLSEHIPLRLISSKPTTTTIKERYEPQEDFPVMSKIIGTVNRYGKKLIYGDEEQSDSEGVIFHCHGGGFIAMSSFSHEMYLRPWAKKTGLPIVSVDYTKTPDQHYPVQLEECYQSYRWLLANAESIGVSLNKIIFAGDSAGGNLALAVLLRAIHDGIRLPDAMMLSYPATYLHFAPSPARIVSLLDPLLNFKLLELCGLEYYMNPKNVHVKNNAQRNPLISPAMAPDEIVAQFPKTYINVGSLDPLFDDSIYLAKRIEEIRGKEYIKLEVYDALGHGYLNLIDWVPESKLASNRICDWMNSQFQ